MNTANLQLEGLYIFLAFLLDAMREKGVFERQELEAIFEKAERALASDPNRPAEMRDANVDAICFPVRILRQALDGSLANSGNHSFTDLASRVGQAKRES